MLRSKRTCFAHSTGPSARPCDHETPRRDLAHPASYVRLTAGDERSGTEYDYSPASAQWDGPGEPVCPPLPYPLARGARRGYRVWKGEEGGHADQTGIETRGENSNLTVTGTGMEQEKRKGECVQAVESVEARSCRGGQPLACSPRKGLTPYGTPLPWVQRKSLWSGRWDLNPRQLAWEARTLPLSYARSRSIYKRLQFSTQSLKRQVLLQC
jgi:hypothetical protein